MPMTTETNTDATGLGGIGPIARSTVREAVRDALRDLIISGGVSADVPLRQDELAARLNVSRTPLREALHGLVAEGLITIDARGVAMVSKPTVEQLLDLYEVREQLEVLAGRKVVAIGDVGHLDEVVGINEQMSAVNDPVEWAQLNQQFHARLYASCANRELIDLIAVLAARAKFYVRILVSSKPDAQGALHGHQQMIDALRAGDADAMEAAIRDHLRSTVAHVAPALRE
jgi:DNA-binding GntR family transcriptional regulator